MNSPKQSLGLKEGIALAIGSIMGSGVLFLPSLTFSLSPTNIIYVWLLTTFACVPLALIFTDMVQHVEKGSGIEGFITLGLGKSVGKTVPLLMLGTVCIGMPASAFIVGEYVSQLFSKDLQLFVAGLIVSLGIISNLCGVRTTSKVQIFLSLLMSVVGIFLVIISASTNLADYQKLLVPSWDIKGFLSATAVAFWAYAGFENLTFLAGEFKNLERDFKKSLLIALFLCGTLYLLLSMVYATVVPIAQINPLAGLFQLANISGFPLSKEIVTLFAVIAVLLNFNSWILGISQLIASSAHRNILPKYFAVYKADQTPRRAIYLLGVLFSITLSLFAIKREIVSTCLQLVSSNFVFIYVLSLISYLSYSKKIVSKVCAFFLLLFLVPLLFNSFNFLFYPIGLMLISLLFTRIAKVYV